MERTKSKLWVDRSYRNVRMRLWHIGHGQRREEKGILLFNRSFLGHGEGHKEREREPEELHWKSIKKELSKA